ncbi:MAG TPA: hypothetical protein VMV94_10545 [Phycisphaerae bacterium]|nr:hypothetical protein [Phycisphaerae bacterium]
MRTLLKSIVAIVAIAVACKIGQVGRAADPPPNAANPTAGPAPRIHANGQFRGMAIQLDGGSGIYNAYSRLVPEVAELGSNSVLFVVHGWQDHAGSLDLHIDSQRTANAKELGKLCDLAKAQGLRVILMPIVLLAHPRNNEWRGKIIPGDRDWDAWFKRYTRFVVYFAKIAEQHHVDLLMVGSELIKTETYTDQWRRVIQEVRRNYRGKLGYSANWDHYQTEKIKFWDALDYVGMTSYYELAAGPNPPIEEIDRNWAAIKKDIKTFQEEVGKPIIFTEVGWCSQEGAAHEGWNYYANQKATDAGRQEQAVLYESFIKTWTNEPGVGGIIWWEWDTGPGGEVDFNYTPRGKPAETLLRRWFAGEFDLRMADKPESTHTTGG